MAIGGVNTSNIDKLYDQIRRDLLDSKIPHYKPMGIRIDDLGVDITAVRKNRVMGISVMELGFLLSDLVIARPTIQSWDNQGQLILSPQHSTLQADTCNVTAETDFGGTDNIDMWFTGQGGGAKPITLIPNYNLKEYIRNQFTFHILFRWGSGSVDFDENNLLLQNTLYFPLRTHYDLYDFVQIKSVDRTKGCLNLKYMREIDEQVLEETFNNYFKISREVQECLN